ncbi:hypothetical protein NON20_24000 (plasmid) [Synechocystis sp. B12]|nr:hypothetical protein NON20_24000 [Synechocystis sp. B12]
MAHVAPTPHDTDPRKALRALDWRRPERARYPRLIEQAIARLQAVAADPHGAAYQALFADAPVWSGGSRERAKRCDGARNVVSLLCTLIACADLRGGFVAVPRGDGEARRWERKSWTDLDGFAYGQLVDGARSLRRTERAARELIAQGYVRSQEWRVHHRGGEIRSVAGIKIVQDKLWRALGLYAQLRQWRRQESRDRVAARVQELENVARRDRARERSGRSGPVSIGELLPAAAAAGGGSLAPADEGPPEKPPSATALESIQRLQKLFGE